jgi:hypothetical protein
MDAAVTHRDRRRAPRRAPHAGEPLSRVRVRAGRELSVVNVSSGGVLVEGDARLLPGTHLEVHVIAASGRTLVRSRVTRAYVAELWADRVLYRAALAFERVVDVSGPGILEAAMLVAGGHRLPDQSREEVLQPGIDYPGGRT